MSKAWFRAALIRAIRTFAQGFLAIIPTTAIVLSDVNWLMCLSSGAFAALVSFVMSLAGLPEVPVSDETKIPEEEEEIDG